ncbi:MAG: hypothetical protein KZQ94_20895 [Candidatus Thiodiazotropha sp. (ex Troendleina suluensis)]|nr:hypothetical protein [Candidatus Thiodiazotropha sp. (ex Troendleina suluensis)]
MNKTVSYVAGIASIVLAYYALKDRGFFSGANPGPVDPGLPDTDPVDIQPGYRTGGGI